jgi:serine/threonine protein kinase
MDRRIFKRYDASKYQNSQELGRGTYGVVYSVYETELNKTIVIKVIPKKIAGTKITNEASILREVDILSRLRRVCDKHIVCYMDFMEDDGNFYIITEYLGQYISLTKFITDIKLTPIQYVTVIENLKSGMHDFHSLGVVHRDIKPDNIMINPTTFDVKYIDFGLSCHTSLCYNPDKSGSPLYMAPEVIIAHAGDQSRIPTNLFKWFQADYWSLGMTIMELALKQPYCEYYAIKYLGQPQVDWPQLIESAYILVEDGITEEAILDYCKKFFVTKAQSYMTKYFTRSVLPLLRGDPTQRVLIRSRIEDTKRKFYQDQVLISF